MRPNTPTSLAYVSSQANRLNCLARYYYRSGQAQGLNNTNPNLFKQIQPLLKAELIKEQRAIKMLRQNTKPELIAWLNTLPAIFRAEWATRFNHLRGLNKQHTNKNS